MSKMTMHCATPIDFNDPELDPALEALDGILALPIGEDRSFFAVERAIKAAIPGVSDVRAYELADWVTALNVMTRSIG